MVNYSIERKHLKSRVEELTLFQSKFCLIAAAIALIPAIYFLVVGYMVDREALIFGYSFLFLIVAMCFICVVIFCQFKSMIFQSFNAVCLDGKIDYVIEKTEETFEIKCINNNKSFVFSIDDISGISFQKNIIIVKLNSQKIIDFPNVYEIRQLFS